MWDLYFADKDQYDYIDSFITLIQAQDYIRNHIREMGKYNLDFPMPEDLPILSQPEEWNLNKDALYILPPENTTRQKVLLSTYSGAADYVVWNDEENE